MTWSAPKKNIGVANVVDRDGERRRVEHAAELSRGSIGVGEC